jgi:GTP-binding protein EngB required for normal cell division
MGSVKRTKEICDKSKSLFFRSCERTSNEEIKVCLNIAIETISHLENMFVDSPYYAIAFAGLTNVGKSTFLNALLGGMIAPVKNRPWSSTSVEYMYGDKIESTLSYSGTFKKQRKEFDSFEDLLEFLESCAVQGSSMQTLEKLIIKFPFASLSKNVVIVDTPGFGATEGHDNEGLHDEQLLKYIETTNNLKRIFWIVKGDTIDKNGVDFFEKYLSNKCTDLIVNMTSDMNAEEIERYEKRHRPQIGNILNIHYVNAKKALKGMQENNNNKLAKAGVLHVRDIINEISTPEGRAEIVKKDLLSLYRDLCEHIAMLDNRTSIWMPTDLGMLKQCWGKTGNQKFIAKVNQYFKQGYNA